MAVAREDAALKSELETVLQGKDDEKVESSREV